MQIEPATPLDADEISSLVIELSEPFFTSPVRAGAEPFLVSVSPTAERGYLSSANYSYHVARQGSRLAGVVAMRDQSHLFHLFVAKDFQGRRLASRLWETVRLEATRCGNPGMFTVNASLNAVPVYQRFGFVPAREVQHVHGISFLPMKLSAGSAT